MNKNVIIALASLLAAFSFTQFSKESPIDSSIPSHVIGMFQEWLQVHGKTYQRPEELVHRLKIFFENYLYITEMNAKNEGSLVLSLNHFADLHVDEFYHSKDTERDIEDERKKEELKRKEALNPPVKLETQVNQGTTGDVVNWESFSGQRYLPPIGRQDTTCNGASFAWALQYAITASDSDINRRSNPMPVSAQYFLDCGDFKCDQKLYNSDLRKYFYSKILPLEDEYPGARTGRPGSCQAFNPSSKEKPYIRDYQSVTQYDKGLEDKVQKGVVIARVYFNRKVVQFYTRGVVMNKQCDEGFSSDKGYFVIAVTGYSRKGDGQSGAFWQVRFAYGDNYGVFGSMWVEKENGSFSSFGPCEIHYEGMLPIAKKW
jgi:Cathepsin propeptide inhibitor domain (I29)/Papain family cysteine protease